MVFSVTVYCRILSLVLHAVQQIFFPELYSGFFLFIFQLLYNCLPLLCQFLVHTTLLHRVNPQYSPGAGSRTCCRHQSLWMLTLKFHSQPSVPTAANLQRLQMQHYTAWGGLVKPWIPRANSVTFPTFKKNTHILYTYLIGYHRSSVSVHCLFLRDSK